jgi:putative ABC transport system permease protein
LTALRNLVKNRVTALINITGLSVAFTCCILLFLLVHYEFSVDGFQREGRRLFMAYALTNNPDGEQRGQSMAYPAASAIKADIPGVVATTAFMKPGGSVRYNGKELEKDIRRRAR